MMGDDMSDGMNHLLTFRNAADPDRALRVAEDISAVTGLSVRRTSIDLAKALVDPTPERLSRFYIEIDGVAYTGNTDEIEGDLLTAIEAQVGGAGGRYRQAKELEKALGELKEAVIHALGIDRLVHWLARRLDRTRK